MATPSVVVFDVNETLSDLEPLGRRFEEVGLPGLAPLWFASVLRDGFALTAAGAPARFADVGAEVLRSMLPPGPGADGDRAVELVLGGFTSLALHTDVVPGVRALRAAGLRLVTMSNGAASVAEALLEGGGIREEFEQLLSVEQAGVWKPAAGAYRFVAERCGVDVEDLVMVAVHPWDLDGAARAGLRTAWVDRDGAHYPSYATAPTWTVRSVEELAEVLR